MRRRDKYGSDPVGRIIEADLTSRLAEYLQPINNRNIPTYDPADLIITRHLKDWINDQDIPWWTRSQILMSTPPTSVKLTKTMVLSVVLHWVLSRGLELISLLIADKPMIFLPSRDSYYWNPPHLSPCMVQSRVRDTFLLESGMLGVIG
jgi:hypothetical protein